MQSDTGLAYTHGLLELKIQTSNPNSYHVAYSQSVAKSPNKNKVDHGTNEKLTKTLVLQI